MSETNTFTDLIRRVRAGDTAAAEELWQRYEPALRRAIRVRLRDPRLRRVFDENDICQSVMASFFVRATTGQFTLEGPEDLQRLLGQMGRNKLALQIRRQQAQRRDCRRLEQFPEGEAEAAAGTESSPSQVVAWRDLWQQFHDRLDAEERRLLELRRQGSSWAEIARLLGGSEDARRVQLNRAVARVSGELGLAGMDEQ